MKHIELDGSQTVDLTDYDFSTSPTYQTRPVSYHAYELTEDETIVRSWGMQEMKKGDWVVLKPSSNGTFKKSGVKREAFLRTYRPDLQVIGNYIKESFIKAVKIDQPFQFVGIDSDSPEQAPAGSYLVLNLDQSRQPIVVNGRYDIFFYTESDLLQNYVLAQTENG